MYRCNAYDLKTFDEYEDKQYSQNLREELLIFLNFQPIYIGMKIKLVKRIGFTNLQATLTSWYKNQIKG